MRQLGFIFLLKCDIAYSIMNRKKLNKLSRELARLRRAPQKAAALESLAKALGRKLVNRGKEPVWESAEFNDLYPVSIPHHGARDVSPGVKNSILDQLEDDIQAWEIKLEDDEDSNTNSADGDADENDGNRNP